MKIKISQTIEKEIELESIYYEYGGFHKILSADTHITARVYNGEYLIEKSKNMPMVVENIVAMGTPISKEAFMKGYNKAMNHIVHEAFMQEFEGATKAELRKAIYESNMDVCNAVNNI